MYEWEVILERITYATLHWWWSNEFYGFLWSVIKELAGPSYWQEPTLTSQCADENNVCYSSFGRSLLPTAQVLLRIHDWISINMFMLLVQYRDACIIVSLHCRHAVSVSRGIYISLWALVRTRCCDYESRLRTTDSEIRALLSRRHHSESAK